MIIKLKENNEGTNDLTLNQPYFVIGIEANDFRILNDQGKPYLYSFDLFQIVDSNEPKNWITEYGEDGERYSYPPELNEVGFFEDFFDGVELVVCRFWNVVNQQLSKVA